jgi:hypothetical protein
VSILTKVAETFKSLTSQKANEDPPPGVEVPDTDGAAVPRPDREPMVGFEPGPDDRPG